MDICFEILDNSKDALKNSEMDTERRSDPVYVSRMITAMVTSMSLCCTRKQQLEHVLDAESSHPTGGPIDPHTRGNTVKKQSHV